MDAVSYPDSVVVDFIAERVVPLRVPADAEPLASDFHVVWTPTIVLLDFYGREHYRTVGFLPPDELVASLLFGIASLDFQIKEFNDAVLNLNHLLERYPRSSFAPEAVYLRGVCRYKGSHEAQALKEIYEKLKADYPESGWTLRAQPYSLL